MFTNKTTTRPTCDAPYHCCWFEKHVKAVGLRTLQSEQKRSLPSFGESRMSTATRVSTHLLSAASFLFPQSVVLVDWVKILCEVANSIHPTFTQTAYPVPIDHSEHSVHSIHYPLFWENRPEVGSLRVLSRERCIGHIPKTFLFVHTQMNQCYTTAKHGLFCAAYRYMTILRLWLWTMYIPLLPSEWSTVDGIINPHFNFPCKIFGLASLLLSLPY